MKILKMGIKKRRKTQLTLPTPLTAMEILYKTVIRNRTENYLWRWILLLTAADSLFSMMTLAIIGLIFWQNVIWFTFISIQKTHHSVWWLQFRMWLNLEELLASWKEPLGHPIAGEMGDASRQVCAWTNGHKVTAWFFGGDVISHWAWPGEEWNTASASRMCQDQGWRNGAQELEDCRETLKLTTVAPKPLGSPELHITVHPTLD